MVEMEAAAGSCQQAAVVVRAALPSLPSAPPLAPLLWALLVFLVAAGLGVAIAGRCRRRSAIVDKSCFWRLCSRGSTVLALAPQGEPAAQSMTTGNDALGRCAAIE